VERRRGQELWRGRERGRILRLRAGTHLLTLAQVTHESKRYLQLKYGELTVLVWKSS
jgi:hypothetical protein